MIAKLDRLRNSICVDLIAIVFLLTLSGQPVLAQSPKNQNQGPQFGGTYANLKPVQRRLIDEWFRQYNELTKQKLKSTEDYDKISLSIRTTFEAVTHALMTTKLTDSKGRSLGTAIDVIAYIETVQGNIPKASGDLQFRIYAALKPTALQALGNSREFKRGGDNTHYHKGYPINYRQQGKEPTIQVSCSPDGKRADVDVDYRSAKFPQAVFNGHLTSSNSDVRAGDNYNRHTNKWSGFANWWRNIFGVPLKEADLREEDEKASSKAVIPLSPRSGKGKIEEAAYDFLNSWLVEQKPNLSIAYVSRRAHPCVDLVATDEKKKLNPGLIPFYILEQMKKTNKAIGKKASLAEAASGVQLKDPSLKILNQPHNTQFVMFEVPNDTAFEFECGNRNSLTASDAAKKPSRKYGDYFGTALHLKSPQATGGTLLILWTKEDDYWKVVSWEVEPDKVEQAKTPNLGIAPAAAEIKTERVPGDPGLITATQSFFDDWFVKQNFDKTIGYFSPQCYPCVNLYLQQGGKMVRNSEEARRNILDGTKKIAAAIGRKEKLEDAIAGIVPVHPDVKVVTHPQEQAYTLLGVPDEIAKAVDCKRQVEGRQPPQKVSGPAVYGNYYGSIFQLKVPGSPAALKFLWAKENGQWKIIAYSVEVP